MSRAAERLLSRSRSRSRGPGSWTGAGSLVGQGLQSVHAQHKEIGLPFALTGWLWEGPPVGVTWPVGSYGSRSRTPSVDRRDETKQPEGDDEAAEEDAADLATPSRCALFPDGPTLSDEQLQNVLRHLAPGGSLPVDLASIANPRVRRRVLCSATRRAVAANLKSLEVQYDQRCEKALFQDTASINNLADRLSLPRVQGRMPGDTCLAIGSRIREWQRALPGSVESPAVRPAEPRTLGLARPSPVLRRQAAYSYSYLPSTAATAGLPDFHTYIST